MPAFSSALPRWSVLLAWLAASGSGCGGRTGEDFPLDAPGEGGEGGSPGSGGKAQAGGASSKGGASGKGGSPGSGGKTFGSGGRPATSGGTTNRGGTGGSGGTTVVAGAGGNTPRAFCGNGVPEPGELCDPGNGGAAPCSYGASACTVCGATCRWVSGVTSFCGDGKVDPAYESCDDGNTETELCPYGLSSCSICDAKCQKTIGASSFCGDGKLDRKFGEDCDDGNASTELCPYGQTSCAVCGSSCAKTAGIVSYCGDGRLDSNYEVCDPGSLPTQVCAYGQTSCRVCDAACSVVEGETSFCGDGVVDESNGERCDPGFAAKDCTLPCTPRCGSIPGPPLPESLDQWPDSGIWFTAMENATLEGFVFNNQGKADTITLMRLSDKAILGSMRIAAGSAPSLSVDVSWNVDAGQSYALYSSDGSNGRWTSFTAYPTSVFGGIRVDGLYTPGAQVTTYWFTFTELRSCPR